MMPNAVVVLLLSSLPLLLPLMLQIAAPRMYLILIVIGVYAGKLTRAPRVVDITRGGLPRRAAARLGSAHSRNFFVAYGSVRPRRTTPPSISVIVLALQ